MDDVRFVNSLEKHLLVIQYARGSAGNLVQRIIGADSQYYWDNDINNNEENIKDSLIWPDKGFRLQNSKLNTEEQLSACHTGYCNIFNDGDTTELIKNVQLVKKAMKNKQKLIVKTDFDIRSFNKSVPIVRIIGSPKRKIKATKPLEKVLEVNTLNIDINKLLFTDFDNEYEKLCSYLKLTPNNRVKIFIQIWLSKQ